MKHLFKKIAVFVTLMALPLALAGQTITVSGTVVDSNNDPLPGVSVFEEGTRNGVISNLDGNYSLSVRSGQARIVFSCIGFQTKTFAASELASIKRVTLEDDSIMLEDAVAIGYGTVKKEDLTGSVTAIRAEEINRGIVTSTDELLKGKLTGVQILPGGGGPGSSGTIRIRGAASLNASNDPLIVVDGVPLAHGNLSMINPNDIESFSILKDASASAIYGSRASNGVIMVTTKKGQPGQRLRVSYTGSFSLKQNPSRINTMTPDEFKSTLKNYYTQDVYDRFVGPYETDWQGLVLQTAYNTEHNVSLSGSAWTAPYRVSLNFNRDVGTIKNSWNNRGSVSFSTAPTFFDDHLKISLNGRMTVSDGYSQNVLQNAAYFNPTMPPYFYNADGSIDYTTARGYFGYGVNRGEAFQPDAQAQLHAVNPLATIYDTTRSGLTKRYVANAVIDYKVHGFEDLRFNLNVGYEGRDSWSMSGNTPGSFMSLTDTEARGVGKYTASENSNYNKMLEFYANYNHDFNGHRVDFMAGYSYTHVFSHSYSESRFFDDFGQYKKDEVYGIPSQNDQENFLISFYGRLNYSYKGRYLLTATLRNDGSSRFSPKTRWGLFPSVALAWNAKQEDFLKQNSVVSALKFRVGWGVTGQQNIGSNYPYLARYSLATRQWQRYNMGKDGIAYILSPSTYDSEIKWEETVTLNAGVDFGFLNDRISGNVDVYKRNTRDLLNNVNLPLGANFSNSLLTNVGSIENKGVEIALNFVPVSNRDWNVQLGLTGTFQSTIFTKLSNTTDKNYEVKVGSLETVRFDWPQVHRVDYAPYTFKLWQQLYDANGKPIQNGLLDRDGDGQVTDNDKYLVTDKRGKPVKPAPDFFYGVTFKTNWKRWDFGFNGHGSVGNWLFNDVYGSHSTTFANTNYIYLANFLRTVYQSDFHAENTVQQSMSDMFLENASFFRLDDINVGYTLPWRGGKSTMRFAFSVQNVFVLTGYSGIDPEASGESGIDRSLWPRPRIYTFKLGINF